MDFEGFKNLLGILGILLFIQFWLGMSINLFVGLPPVDPQNFQNYTGGYQVLIHIGLAGLVLGLGAVTVGSSLSLKSAVVVRLSILGFFIMVLALVNGMVFLLEGQDSSISLGMAVTFLSAFTVYFLAFYFVGKAQAAQQAMQS
jgi:hypothetical protein